MNESNDLMNATIWNHLCRIKKTFVSFFSRYMWPTKNGGKKNYTSFSPPLPLHLSTRLTKIAINASSLFFRCISLFRSFTCSSIAGIVNEWVSRNIFARCACAVFEWEISMDKNRNELSNLSRKLNRFYLQYQKHVRIIIHKYKSTRWMVLEKWRARLCPLTLTPIENHSFGPGFVVMVGWRLVLVLVLQFTENAIQCLGHLACVCALCMYLRWDRTSAVTVGFPFFDRFNQPCIIFNKH